MLRYDGLVKKSFAVSDGDKMAASYENIINLHPTLPTTKFRQIRQLFDKPGITLSTFVKGECGCQQN